MIYKIEGKIIKILDTQRGAKRAGGEWVKQEFVIETSGDEPDKVAFFQWDELINLRVDDVIAVSFSIKTREWNDKWFTNLLAEDIIKLTESSEDVQDTSMDDTDFEMPDDSGELPF